MSVAELTRSIKSDLCSAFSVKIQPRSLRSFGRSIAVAATLLVVPLFAYGEVPRRELCTQESLEAALQTVVIEPGGQIEQKWKLLCEQMHVAWPQRLTKAA